MNILGFGAVTVTCVTLIIIVTLLVKAGITIRIEKTEKKDMTDYCPAAVEKPAPKEDLAKLEEELNKKKDFQASMDAVIKSANELMGIETKEDDVDGK